MPEATTYITRSAAETVALGRQLSAQLPTGKTVLLIGNLGAGKTTLVKGIAEGLGVASEDEVSSPTFSLVHEYGDPLRLYHLDLYRLDTAAEVLGIGMDDMLDRGVLVLIEWGERFPSLWPEDTIRIELERINEDTRRITINGITAFPSPSSQATR